MGRKNEKAETQSHEVEVAKTMKDFPFLGKYPKVQNLLNGCGLSYLKFKLKLNQLPSEAITEEAIIKLEKILRQEGSGQVSCGDRVFAVQQK